MSKTMCIVFCVQAFQLAAPSRHMIYAAELLHYQDRWNKVRQLIICSPFSKILSLIHIYCKVHS